MDLFEMKKMIAELECTNEKAKTIMGDIYNTYFGEKNPQTNFLKYYYDMACIKSSIVLDYINETDLLLRVLKETVNKKIENS